METKHFNYFIMFFFCIFLFFSCSLEETRNIYSTQGDQSTQNRCIYPNNNHIEIDIDLHKMKYDFRRNATLRTIKKIYKRLERKQIHRLLKYFDQDVEWKVEGVEEAIPFAGTYYGKEGVRQYIDNLSNSLRKLKLTLTYYILEDNEVNMHFIEKGIVISTGKEYSMEVVHCWKLNDTGKIVKYQGFNHTFALYHAFNATSNPDWSIANFTANYSVPESNYNDTYNRVMFLYNAFLTGDLETLFAGMDENIIWILAGHEEAVPFAGTFYGVQGVREYTFILVTTVGFSEYIILDTVVDGCRIDTQIRETVYSLDTGRSFQNEVIHSIIVNNDGNLSSFRSYNDTYKQQSIIDWQ